MIVYGVTVVLSILIVFWAAMVFEDTKDKFCTLATAIVAGAGFAVFPVLNVVSSIILLAILLDQREQNRVIKEKSKCGL
jgi:hypothetical protein